MVNKLLSPMTMKSSKGAGGLGIGRDLSHITCGQDDRDMTRHFNLRAGPYQGDSAVLTRGVVFLAVKAQRTG